jgi:hypothetical protein
MSPVCKVADNGLLTVGQNVKVVLFYARFAQTNGNRQGTEATVCIMGNRRRGRTSQYVVFLCGLLREKMFQRRPENVAQLRAHK